MTDMMTAEDIIDQLAEAADFDLDLVAEAIAANIPENDYDETDIQTTESWIHRTLDERAFDICITPEIARIQKTHIRSTHNFEDITE